MSTNPLIRDTQQKTTFSDPVPYCSIGYADAYLATDLLKVDIWTSLTTAQKTAALKMATNDIDALHYQGFKQHWAQVRKFPRFFNFGTIGDVFYLENPIPEEVARACAVQAWYRAKQYVLGEDVDGRQDHQAQGISSISRVGSSESSNLNRARKHAVCAEAMRYLQPFFKRTANLEEQFGWYQHGYGPAHW